MNNDKLHLVLEMVKSTAMLLIVCIAILLSLEVLVDVELFSVKRVIAMMVLVESVYALKSVA